MRICLLTGGGYPYRRDALGGWCRTLVEGLAGSASTCVTVTDREPPAAPAYPLPGNVDSARAVALPRDDAAARRARDEHATAAAALLCRGLLGDEPATTCSPTGCADSPALAAAATPERRWPPCRWPTCCWTPGGPGRLADAGELPLPRLSLRDARTAATLLRHAARRAGRPLPEADLVHCVGGTTPLLAALAGRWRSGRRCCSPRPGRRWPGYGPARSGCRPRSARCCAGSAARWPAPGTPRPA